MQRTGYISETGNETDKKVRPLTQTNTKNNKIATIKRDNLQQQFDAITANYDLYFFPFLSVLER